MTVCVQPMPSPPGIGSVRSRLARFDADLLSLHNLLHRQTAPWRIVLGQRPMHVSLASAGGECRRPVRVAIRFGQAYLELVVPSRLFELSGLGWLPGASVDTQTDTLLLEQAWLSWIEPLETLSGEPVQVLPWPAHPLENPLRLALEVRPDEGQAQALEIHLNADSARHVIALLDRNAVTRPQPLDALVLTLSVEAGQAPSTTAELHSLVPGDVVMLDTLADTQVLLRLGKRYRTVARHQGETLEWLGPLRTVSPHYVSHTFNRNDSMSEMTDGSDLDTSLDELPLTLVCQLGSVELTLAQLREMAPGSLLPLAGSRHDEVDLMVNGRRIGRGELVSIGDGLGVRLLGFTAS
ncbi:YscQ/HrcQ family type III secretion apparatus protein [Pseudomonas amygdali pv. morsprunorum]|nr:type III secretion system cytoplasmic ring protein SctQ [Pseudomonas amygdali]POY77039.1 YscQ/HrcQ family type III secretion apparatus protein [Pseudomonas amygdali pv. morsprunorum]